MINCALIYCKVSDSHRNTAFELLCGVLRNIFPPTTSLIKVAKLLLVHMRGAKGFSGKLGSAS
jgi:hypothetical protein